MTYSGPTNGSKFTATGSYTSQNMKSWVLPHFRNIGTSKFGLVKFFQQTWIFFLFKSKITQMLNGALMILAILLPTSSTDSEGSMHQLLSNVWTKPSKCLDIDFSYQSTKFTLLESV